MMNYLAATAKIPEHLKNMSMADAGLYAGLGYLVVFFGIVLLMIVVMIMGKIFVAAEKKKNAKPAAAVAAPVVEAAPVAAATNVAPGTAGQLKLYDTSPKTAAMIMAIVAEKTGKPLNELRFISIKEVK